MAKGIVRQTCLEGVTVKVVQHRNSFDVLITIPKGTNLWQKRENEHCWVKFKTHKFHKAAHKEIELKVSGAKYDTTQLLKHFRKEFGIEEGGRCSISLFPEFYLPEDLAEKSKREREYREKYGKFTPGICTRVGGAKRQKRGSSTVYTRNNAGHPYPGGKCTPK